MKKRLTPSAACHAMKMRKLKRWSMKRHTPTLYLHNSHVCPPICLSSPSSKHTSGGAHADSVVSLTMSASVRLHVNGYSGRSCGRSWVSRENRALEGAGRCRSLKWLGGCEMRKECVLRVCGQEPSSGPRRQKGDKLTYSSRASPYK